jgi:hypothetical protein
MHEYFKKQIKFMQLKQHKRIIKVTYKQTKRKRKNNLQGLHVPPVIFKTRTLNTMVACQLSLRPSVS